MDQSLYIERARRALVGGSCCPVGPVGAVPASHYAHVARIASLRTAAAAAAAAPPCRPPARGNMTVVPCQFAYSDCWNASRMAALMAPGQPLVGNRMRCME